MRKGIYILPSALTLCGMFFGFFSIISTMRGDFALAAWSIVAAGVFDGLDGFVARLTHSTTKFGIELDSLSDLVAFGVAPAILFYKWTLLPFGRIGWAVAFLFAACGALRLARYNVQMVTAERKYFTGMPIPAAAGTLATTVIFFTDTMPKPENLTVMLILIITLALIMVSTFKFHSIKELDFSKRKPFWFLVTFVIILAFIIMEPEITLFTFAMLYLSVGVVENTFLFVRQLRTRKKEA